MTDTTSPSGTVESGPLSFNDGVSAIENLLSGDPETDLANTDEAEASADEPEVDSDEPDLVIDDEADEASAEAKTAPPAVSDDTLVELSDGQKISIGELKRNNLFQRDYSRKTEEAKRAEERREAEYRERVERVEKEIRDRAELVFRLSDRIIPQKPTLEMLRDDPIGYMEAQAQYEAQVAEFNQLYAAEAQQTEAQREAAKQQELERIEAERVKMLEAMPKFKDKAKFDAFRSDVGEIGVSHYKLTPEELGSIADHRFMLVLHDAIQYRKAVAKSKQTQQEVVAKPRLEQRQRMQPQAAQVRDRQGRFEALRQSGSIDAAARAIESILID